MPHGRKENYTRVLARLSRNLTRSPYNVSANTNVTLVISSYLDNVCHAFCSLSFFIVLDKSLGEITAPGILVPRCGRDGHKIPKMVRMAAHSAFDFIDHRPGVAVISHDKETPGRAVFHVIQKLPRCIQFGIVSESVAVVPEQERAVTFGRAGQVKCDCVRTRLGFTQLLDVFFDSCSSVYCIRVVSLMYAN